MLNQLYVQAWVGGPLRLYERGIVIVESAHAPSIHPVSLLV